MRSLGNACLDVEEEFDRGGEGGGEGSVRVQALMSFAFHSVGWSGCGPRSAMPLGNGIGSLASTVTPASAEFFTASVDWRAQSLQIGGTAYSGKTRAGFLSLQRQQIPAFGVMQPRA
jgi:hypothetical protein